jgi:hypothetical protein
MKANQIIEEWEAVQEVLKGGRFSPPLRVNYGYQYLTKGA